MAQPRPEWDRILSAAQKNDTALIQTLVMDRGVDPNHANYVGQSALHVASLWGNIATVKLLTSLPTIALDAQNQVSGATPLHSAVQSRKEPAMNRLECVRLLVDAGADVQIEDMYDMTPLDAFKALIEKGMIETEDSEYVEAMEAILASASVQRAGEKSEIIPFVEAMDLQGLIDKLDGGGGSGSGSSGGDSIGTSQVQVQIDERDRKSGMTAMYLATQKLGDLIESSDDENTEFINQVEVLSKIILALLGKNADPCAIPKVKVSVLDTTSSRDTDTLAMLYVICKALTSQYHSFSTKVRGDLESVALGFIQAGATVSPPIQKMMHDAARRGNIENVKFWVDRMRVDPNTKGRQGLTPLHFAARSGKVELAEWLLSIDTDGSKKVDISITDDRGKTALDAASSNGHQDIVRLLEVAREGMKE